MSVQETPQAAALEQLREEIQASGRNFIYRQDTEFDEPMGDEYAHFQFIGLFEGREVIYDAVMYTLRLKHGSLVYEEAEKRASKEFPLFVPLEDRDETYQPNEDMDEAVELLVTEIIEEIEENEEIRVAEHVETVMQDDGTVEMDVCLHREAITDQLIEQFVVQYRAETLQLDPTLFTFSSLDEDDDA